jgi:hypothetical protein
MPEGELVEWPLEQRSAFALLGVQRTNPGDCGPPAERSGKKKSATLLGRAHLAEPKGRTQHGMAR